MESIREMIEKAKKGELSPMDTLETSAKLGGKLIAECSDKAMDFYMENVSLVYHSAMVVFAIRKYENHIKDCEDPDCRAKDNPMAYCQKMLDAVDEQIMENIKINFVNEGVVVEEDVNQETRNFAMELLKKVIEN